MVQDALTDDAGKQKQMTENALAHWQFAMVEPTRPKTNALMRVKKKMQQKFADGRTT